jgi:hypothetical protein
VSEEASEGQPSVPTSAWLALQKANQREGMQQRAAAEGAAGGGRRKGSNSLRSNSSHAGLSLNVQVML